MADKNSQVSLTGGSSSSTKKTSSSSTNTKATTNTKNTTAGEVGPTKKKMQELNKIYKFMLFPKGSKDNPDPGQKGFSYVDAMYPPNNPSKTQISNNKTTYTGMSQKMVKDGADAAIKAKSVDEASSLYSNNDFFSFIKSEANKKTIEQIVRRSINLETMNTDNTKNYNNTFYEYFDKWYSVHPDYELTSLFHYVFITKPDLNVLSDKGTISAVLQNNTTFTLLNEECPHVLMSLCQDVKGSKNPTTFIPMLVGRTHSIQLPDFQIESGNLSQPYTGYLLPYANHGIASTTGGEFEIVFKEYQDLSIHKLFNAWLKYIDGVKQNYFYPKLKYIDNGDGIVVDYMVSVYDIICAPDGKTILFFNKYTGCLPTLTPNSNLSFNLGRSEVERDVSIPFKYLKHENMNPEIIWDFNQNAGVKTQNELFEIVEKRLSPAVDINNYEYYSGSGMVKRPFIYRYAKSPYYILGWEKNA